jgi:hypothetical protein
MEEDGQLTGIRDIVRQHRFACVSFDCEEDINGNIMVTVKTFDHDLPKMLQRSVIVAQIEPTTIPKELGKLTPVASRLFFINLETLLEHMDERMASMLTKVYEDPHQHAREEMGRRWPRHADSFIDMDIEQLEIEYARLQDEEDIWA